MDAKKMSHESSGVESKSQIGDERLSVASVRFLQSGMFLVFTCFATLFLLPLVPVVLAEVEVSLIALFQAGVGLLYGLGWLLVLIGFCCDLGAFLLSWKDERISPTQWLSLQCQNSGWLFWHGISIATIVLFFLGGFLFLVLV